MQYLEKVYQACDWGWEQFYKYIAYDGEIFGALDRQLLSCNEDNPEDVKFLFELFVQRVKEDKRYNVGIANLLKRAIDAGHTKSLRVMARLVSEKRIIQDEIPLVKVEDKIYGFDGSTILGYAVSMVNVNAVNVLHGDCFSKLSTLEDNRVVIKKLKVNALQLCKNKVYRFPLSKLEKSGIEKRFNSIEKIILGKKQLMS